MLHRKRASAAREPVQRARIAALAFTESSLKYYAQRSLEESRADFYWKPVLNT